MRKMTNDRKMCPEVIVSDAENNYHDDREYRTFKMTCSQKVCPYTHSEYFCPCYGNSVWRIIRPQDTS
jgi:hypothetical protein